MLNLALPDCSYCWLVPLLRPMRTGVRGRNEGEPCILQNKGLSELLVFPWPSWKWPANQPLRLEYFILHPAHASETRETFLRFPKIDFWWGEVEERRDTIRKEEKKNNMSEYIKMEESEKRKDIFKKKEKRRDLVILWSSFPIGNNLVSSEKHVT